MLSGQIIPVTPFRQNCLILYDPDRLGEPGVVVDPGGDVATILDQATELGVRIGEIWLTHGHLDHAGGAAELRDAVAARDGAPPAVVGPHAEDAFLLASIEREARKYGIPGMANVMPDRYVAEGETLSALGHRFEVLHVPGHTPGHVLFFDRDARIALVGDTVFAGSVGRTDFAYGDQAGLIEAIKSKLLPLGDDVAFVCGHGPGSTIGAERISNPFLQ